MPKVTVTTSSALGVPAKLERKGVILDNTSANDIYFAFRSPVTAAGAADAGIRLKTGERLVLFGAFTGPLYMIAPAGSSDLNYVDIL